LPAGEIGVDWRPAAGSPVRAAVVPTGPQVVAVRANGSPAKVPGSPARAVISPAKLGGSPARFMGSPARLGLGNSPVRPGTPSRPFLRSPSAPSIGGSPASSAGARDSGGQRHQRSVASGPRSAGDTPRNLTDWRKSLQMAIRQEDHSQRQKTPWR
jgi:hypothetical protein